MLQGEIASGLEQLYLKRGAIHVQSALVLAAGQKLPNLPRFGMQLTMEGDYQQLAWFGRGPHESYADRKTSAAIYQ